MEPFDTVGVLYTLDKLADLGFPLEMIPIADSGEFVKDVRYREKRETLH